jgi:hypothetical protein
LAEKQEATMAHFGFRVASNHGIPNISAGVLNLRKQKTSMIYTSSVREGKRPRQDKAWGQISQTIKEKDLFVLVPRL